MKAIAKNGLLFLCLSVILALCTGAGTSDNNNSYTTDYYEYTVCNPSILEGYSVSVTSTIDSNPMDNPVVYNNTIDILWNEYQKQNTDTEKLNHSEFINNLNLIQTNK